MNINLIDRHVNTVLQIVFGQDLIYFVVLLKKALNFEASSVLGISLVLENLAEAIELGFIPELAECGRGYL
jgi:hypothetical protein